MSKSTKHRACPALGREISSTECGECRGSRIACPAHCNFSPLAPANYDQLLELERLVDNATLEWLFKSRGSEVFGAKLAQHGRPETSEELNAFLIWQFLYEADATDKTWAQRWEQAGFPGLKNDARVLARAKLNLRVMLLEVHRVIDAEQVEVVDLLDAHPKPFIIRDRSFASSATRFVSGLAWVYALPHYHRIFGSMAGLPDFPHCDPQEAILELARHMGGPEEEAPLRVWLAKHMVKVTDAMTAVGHERRRLMFEGIDAKYGKAVYQLQAPFAKCSAVLDEEPDVTPDQLHEDEQREGFADARLWADLADTGEQTAPAMGTAMLGRILMGQSHWRLEAVGVERLQRMRLLFEQRLNQLVRFTGERVDDLAAVSKLKGPGPSPNLSLVPPRLLESPGKIVLTSSVLLNSRTPKSPAETEADCFAAMAREFVDASVPALEGRTPREAARDPRLRPTLIRLMKSRIQSSDQRSLKTGQSYDENWILRELGLDEILFEPPPARPRLLAEVDEEDDEYYEDDDWSLAEPMDPDLPPAPALPDRPFTAAELVALTRSPLMRHELAMSAVEELEADGCTLLADVEEVTEALLEHDEFPLLLPFLVQIWRVFVPIGTRGHNVTRATLEDAIRRKIDQLIDAVEAEDWKSMERHLQAASQPTLALGTFDFVMNLPKKLPKESRPSPDRLLILGAVLLAVIDEVDRIHRHY